MDKMLAEEENILDVFWMLKLLNADVKTEAGDKHNSF